MLRRLRATLKSVPSIATRSAQHASFAFARFGSKLGPGSRYEVVRRLGVGEACDIWLARDAQTRGFVAIKVFTSYAGPAQVQAEGALDVLRRLTSPHCATLVDDFVEPGPGPGATPRVCIVMPPFRGDLTAIRPAAAGRWLPLALAKRILLHTLRGLAFAHARGLVHTNVNEQYIFLHTDIDDDALALDPPRYDAPDEAGREAALVQPLPDISCDDALRATFVLGAWGGARECVEAEGIIGDPEMRAPEVILGARWTSSVDIWAYGALAYHLVVGRPLFNNVPNKKFGLTKEENMLYQMTCYVDHGAGFAPPLLQRSPRAHLFFDRDCSLKKEVANLHLPFPAALAHDNPDLDVETEIPRISDFVNRCLRLEPTERATAEELLSDPWFADVDG